MFQRIQKFLSSRLPALLWTIVIFVLLALPGKMLPSEEHTFIPNLDKYVHVTLFSVFVILWCFYYISKQQKNISYNKLLLRIAIIASLYGIAMEYVQKYFIPNRDFDIYDIAADVAGALLGFLFVRLTVTKFKNS
jgi:VanZ family protein